MKKIKYFSVVIMLFVAIFYFNNVDAAASLGRSASSVNQGDELKVNVNVSGVAAATIKVTFDASKVSYVSAYGGTTNVQGNTVVISWASGSNTNGTVATVTFKAVSTGSASFSLGGQFVDENANDVSGGGSTSVNIVTKNDTSNNNKKTNTTNNNSQESTKKSDNASLKALSIDGLNFNQAFNPNVFEYKVSVAGDVNEINIATTKDDKSATVNVSGNKELKEGDNTVLVDVIAEDGKTKKTYKIIVNKAQSLGRAFLKSLSFGQGNLCPIFNENVYYYELQDIPSNITTLDITALAKFDDSKVEIIGNENFNQEQKIITIKVTSADGTISKEYVVRANHVIEHIDSLKNTESGLNYKIFKFVSNQRTMIIILYIFILIEFIQIVILYIKVNNLKGKDDFMSKNVVNRNNKTSNIDHMSGRRKL